MSIRAVRNNNPGNIRVGQNWQGMMGRALMNAEQSAEKDFVVFLTPMWGFRAMAEIFHTYHDHHDVTTLRGAISRWAPPNENNTGAYLNDVCVRCGTGPDAPFDFRGPKMPDLLRAVSTHEVGSWAFQNADLAKGLAAAH